MASKVIRSLAFLFIFFALSVAIADIVRLNTGGKIIGKIVEEDDTKVVVENITGRTTIKREDIAEIERGETILAMYKKRLSEINEKSPKDHFELAMWCKEYKLADEYENHLKKCLELDPEFIPAREELGYVRFNGKWVEYEEMCKARGWVKYEGQWIPPEKAERLRQGLVEVEGKWVSKKAIEEERTQRKSVIEKYEKAVTEKKDVVIPEDLKQLIELANAPEWEKRTAAYDALYAKGAEAREILTRILFTHRKQARDAILDFFKNNKSDIRSKLAPLIEERRRAALAIIFDRTVYPDANHGASGQAKVDEAVNKLREVYEQVFEFYFKKSDVLQQKWAEYERLAAVINKYTDAKIVLAEERKEIAEEVNKVVAMDKVMAPPDSEEILAYNKTVKTSLTDEERANVDTVNWYRMMLGIRPLRIHEGLVQAARKHSECMEKNGFFSHDCRIHGSPAARCRREGAPFAGENIANGCETGVAAFWSWYHSSGHHRNMLSHRMIGVGRSGQYWTQDFG